MFDCNSCRLANSLKIVLNSLNVLNLSYPMDLIGIQTCFSISLIDSGFNLQLEVNYYQCCSGLGSDLVGLLGPRTCQELDLVVLHGPGGFLWIQTQQRIELGAS